MNFNRRITSFVFVSTLLLAPALASIGAQSGNNRSSESSSLHDARANISPEALSTAYGTLSGERASRQNRVRHPALERVALSARLRAASVIAGQLTAAPQDLISYSSFCVTGLRGRAPPLGL